MIPSRSHLLGYAVVVAVVLAAGASLHSFWLVVLGVVLLAGGYERERRELEAQKERQEIEVRNEVNNQLSVILCAPEVQIKGWKDMIRDAVERVRIAVNHPARCADMVRRPGCKLALGYRSASLDLRQGLLSASDGRQTRKGPQSETGQEQLRKRAGV